MEKDSKKLLFERMHTIGGMPMKEEIDVNQTYIDRRNGARYSGEQVSKYVNGFLNGNIKPNERKNFIDFFNAIDLPKNEYTKPREKRLNKNMGVEDMINLFDKVYDNALKVYNNQNIHTSRTRYYNKLNKIYLQIKDTSEFKQWMYNNNSVMNDIDEDGNLNFWALLGLASM